MKHLNIPKTYPNVSESTVQYLRAQIICGKIAGGERLNENRLAMELGISRPPLRETFRILQNERLVKTIPRIGTFVTELSLDDFKQICDIRLMVEVFAIQQLKSLDQYEFPELRKTLDAHHAIAVPKQFADDEEKYALFKEFASFHLQLVESTGNSYLAHWYRSLSSNIARYQYLFFFQPGIISKDLREHVELLSLINTRQFGKAAALMQAHLEFQRREMSSVLETETQVGGNRTL